MAISSRVAIAALLLSAIAAPPAAAQRFDKVVAFGDSYADIGNVREILDRAGLGAFLPLSVYPTGRFSGGTNFVDTIAAAYGIGQDNYAIGGAQAGPGNVGAQGQLPGFQQQWVAFTQGGSTYTNLATSVPIAVSGVATAIPAGGLRFAPNDLAVFSVGGNDARPYRRDGTLAGAPAAADAAAAQATTGLDALVARGIRHMVFTVGDVGRLAEAVGQADAPIGSAFSAEYNSRIQTTLARYAASGVQVAYVDITRIADVVARNPSRFGFVDTTTPCPAACIGDPALQRRYLFYIDGVHLTSAGFALVGDYAVNQLNAPYGFRAVGDLALDQARGFGGDMTGRLDLARTGARRDGLALFGDFDARHFRRGADDTADGYDFDTRGGIAGAEYRTGIGTAGLIFSYGRGKIDGGGDSDDRVRGRSYQIGGYAGAERGPLFAQAYAGYGWHRFSLTRTGPADPLTASPHATSIVAGGRAGWLTALGPFRVGPVAGLDYVHARTGGYAESEDPAAALIVGHQTIDTLAGSAGVDLRGAKRWPVAPWLRVAAAKTLQGDGRTVAFSAAAAPTIVDRFAVGDQRRGVHARIEGGRTAPLIRGVMFEGQGRAELGADRTQGVAGFVGLRATL